MNINLMVFPIVQTFRSRKNFFQKRIYIKNLHKFLQLTSAEGITQKIHFIFVVCGISVNYVRKMSKKYFPIIIEFSLQKNRNTT